MQMSWKLNRRYAHKILVRSSFRKLLIIHKESGLFSPIWPILFPVFDYLSRKRFLAVRTPVGPVILIDQDLRDETNKRLVKSVFSSGL